MAASTFRAWETLGGPEPSEPTISHWLGGHGADAPPPTPRRPQDEVSGCGSSSNQSTQDLRGLPAQRRLEIGDAGTLIFPLAVRQRRAAMPAGPRRNRLRPADNVAALLVAGEVDDVLRLHYDFLNHCCPRNQCECYRRKASHKRSVQRSNFSGAIHAAVLQRAALS